MTCPTCDLPVEPHTIHDEDNITYVVVPTHATPDGDLCPITFTPEA